MTYQASLAEKLSRTSSRAASAAATLSITRKMPALKTDRLISWPSMEMSYRTLSGAADATFGAA
jgi:hypothetical protein